MSGFLFGIIFAQVSVVFFAGVIMSVILYKGCMGQLAKASERVGAPRRLRRPRPNQM